MQGKRIERKLKFRDGISRKIKFPLLTNPDSLDRLDELVEMTRFLLKHDSTIPQMQLLSCLKAFAYKLKGCSFAVFHSTETNGLVALKVDRQKVFEFESHMQQTWVSICNLT